MAPMPCSRTPKRMLRFSYCPFEVSRRLQQGLVGRGQVGRTTISSGRTPARALRILPEWLQYRPILGCRWVEPNPSLWKFSLMHPIVCELRDISLCSQQRVDPSSFAPRSIALRQWLSSLHKGFIFPAQIFASCLYFSIPKSRGCLECQPY